MLASCLAGSTLLWLAAETAVDSADRPPALARSLLLGSVILGACGLWWPGHALRVGLNEIAGNELAAGAFAWLPSIVLAWLAAVVGRHARRGSWARAMLFAVGLPLAAYVFAMARAPGVFRLGPAWLGAGTLTVGLSLALVAAQCAPGTRRQAASLRAFASMMAGALAGLGAAASLPASDMRTIGFGGTDWAMLLALVGVGVLLRIVLAQTVNGMLPVRTRHARAASLDHLTQLPTRLNLESRLHSAALKCDVRGTLLAVLYIDLDGFKPVNEGFDHASGDRVLEQVGQRLRVFASNGDAAARVGGDEFLLLATRIKAREDAAQLATRVIESLSKPYRINGRDIVISCSVGIAMYPDQCVEGKLIARADAAMYAAKKAGGARATFYAPEMDADALVNFDMLAELRRALTNDELVLYFQPKIDVRSGKVTAAEALVRWQHPTRGLLMPDAFLPMAERSGLIGAIGDWVIEAACKQARAWRDKGLRMRVAINLSPHQMRQGDIADRIELALRTHRIHPSLLTCEITETTAMEDTVATQETFRRLGELGTHLSIDDFGTGYSSLSYLRQLPAEELKIDASFVKDVDTSADARAIVDALVKLAHALGLKVVAEGVENVRQRATLIELGCDELQGYLFAKPMTARALLMWAIDDRSGSGAFRASLFGETRQVMRDHGEMASAPPN